MGGTSLRGILSAFIVAVLLLGCGDSSEPQTSTVSQHLGRGANGGKANGKNGHENHGNGHGHGQGNHGHGRADDHGHGSNCPQGKRICDMDGNVRVCAGHSAGHRNNPTDNVGPILACADGETCYFGECSSGPVVPRPRSGSGGGMLAESIGTVSVTGDVVVIPWEAFSAALAGRAFTAPSAAAVDTAVTTAAHANDVTVHGLSATFTEATEFSGDVFIVVMDPTLYAPETGQGPGLALSSISATSDPERVEDATFFVAAITLSGRSSWVGTDAVWMQYASSNQNRVGLSSTCCTSPDNNPCVKVPFGGTTPGTCTPEFCPLTEAATLLLDPTRTKFRVGNGGLVQEGQPAARPDGLPATTLIVFDDRTAYLNDFDQQTGEALVDRWSEGSAGSGDESDLPGGLACDLCAVTLCEADSFTPDWSIGDPDIPAQCGNNSYSFPADCALYDYSDVPDHCSPACNSCFDQLPGLCGGGYIAFGGQLGTDPGMLSSICGAARPAYCELVEGDPACDCDTACQDGQNKFLTALFSCRNGTGGGGTVSCLADGSGACVRVQSGDGNAVDLCKSCTSDGGCVSYANPVQTSAVFLINNVYGAVDGGAAKGPDSTEDESTDEEKRDGVEADDEKPKDAKPQVPPGAAPVPKVVPLPAPDPADPEPNPGPGAGGRGPNLPADPADTKAADGSGDGVEIEEEDSGRTKKTTPKAVVEPPPFEPVPDYIPSDSPDDATTQSTGPKDSPRRGGESRVKRGDPVDLATGEFRLESTDMEFPAPMGSLLWQRYYRSRSGDRSILGSNWSHNYDYRVQPIDPANAPGWMSSYCTSWFPEITCVMVHTPGAGKILYTRDPATNAFMPPSGFVDTLVFAEGEWLIRRPDKSAMVFNDAGALIENRDRFGNGYAVEHEPVPLFLLYRRYCGREGGNELLDDARGDYDPRMCAMLGYLFEDQELPDLNSSGWSHFRAGSGLTVNEVTVPVWESNAQPTARELDLIGDASDYQTLYAAAYKELKRFVTLGVVPNSPTGSRRFRPVQVTDDLGRQLSFVYYQFADGPVLNGLLRRVEAHLRPGATEVVAEYDYTRPPNQDPRVNESFLVRTDRRDQDNDSRWIQARPRSVSYDYQPVSNSTSLGASLYRFNLATYYQTFLNCEYGEDVLCVGLTRTHQPGNPCFLADLARQEHLSSIADNIITVRRNDLIVESETRYGESPGSESYDRVIAQRYGGTQGYGAPGPNVEPPWQTSYPMTTFAYAGVERTATDTDRTDNFLPPAVAQKYELEDPPPDAATWDCNADGSAGCVSSSPVLPPLVVPACVYTRPTEPGDQAQYSFVSTESCDNDDGCESGICGAQNTCAPAVNCQPRRWRERKKRMPGYRNTWPYFDAEPEYHDAAHEHVELRRSRLTCDQLAAFQAANPAHNDNVHHRNAADQFEWLSGVRPLIEQNLARICAWSRTTDRDGVVTYFGLNYKGLALVQAVENSDEGNLWIKERVFNADGRVVEDRRPVTRPDALQTGWTQYNGLTAYEYDDLSPTGENGWNGWLPFFWQRRGNLVRSTVVPGMVSGMVDTVEWDAQSGDLTVGESEGRVVEVRYDPIYNQPVLVSHGTVEQPDQFRIYYDLDYQELPLESPAMQTVLGRWRTMGAPWLEADNDAFETVRTWQFGVHSYAADLNGDGVQGFDDTASGRTVRGLPVRISFEDRRRPNGEVRTYHLDYAAHGGINMIASPGGRYAFLRYYDANAGGDPFGQMGATGSAGEDGMLASVEINRYDLRTPGQCQGLAGPFADLLDDCGAGTRASLIALGLPAEAADAIIASSEATDVDRQKHRTRITYAPTGHPYTIVEDGLEATAWRDSDGRLIEARDTRGNTTLVTRTLDGWPTFELTTAAVGSSFVSSTSRQFDDEGRVVTECQAVTNAAQCAPFVGSARTPMSFAAPVDDPGYLLHRRRYTAEGLLSEQKDPANTLTKYSYDTRHLPVEQRTLDHVGNNEDRVTRLTRDSDGKITRVQRGSLATRAALGTLDDRYYYDGLARVVTHIDRRGTHWQFGYTPLGELSATKQSTSTYRPGSNDSPAWQILTQYDGLQQAVARSIHGIVVETTTYDEALNPIEVTSTGGGTTKRTFDVDGNVVWERDPDGTQTVSTYHPLLREGFRTTIRSSELGGPLATTVRTKLDVGKAPVETEIFGSDGERRLTEVLRDTLGRPLEVKTSEPITGDVIAIDRFTRNLVGWPVTSTTVDVANPALSDVSDFGYNARGQQIRIDDPSHQLTSMVYDVFGELSARRLPHNGAALNDVFAYDGFGRRSRHDMATGDAIGFEYNPGGDLAREFWLNAPNNTFGDVLTERAYDERGRVVATTDNNLGRLNAGRAAYPIQRTFAYDALDRVVEETVALGGESYATRSEWTETPGSGWQRELTYPSGKVVSRQLDELGRLDFAAVDGRVIDLMWTGELYSGRDHDWSGDPAVDPLRETIILDGLGRGVELRTDMLDRGTSAPLNAAWADAYCQGSYDAALCGSPLFAQDLRRDVLGRARTVQTRWGNPARVSTAEPWRGYEYSSEGQLTAAYEHEGLAESIADLPTLPQVTNSDISNLVANHNNDTAEPILAVDWVREDAVGGLLSMDERGTGVSRWHHQGDRKPGQQLGTIELDGATFAITHDEQGRVIDGAGSTFVYGPRGRLVSITRGNLTEDFAYDAAGRLTRLEDGKTQNIVHDGDQMIAAMEPGLPTPQWEAVWGGQTDQMLEFERFELGINGLFIPVTDHRNSIVGWWDADTRQMRHILEYTPLGRVRLLAPDGTERCVEEGSGIDCVKAWDPPPFGFASAYRSEVSGISYMRNRWYAPKLGQFLTHDPLGYLDGYNPYTYGVGDPINYWDPYGLAGKFMAGLRLGFLDKVGQLAGDVWKGLNWLSESLFSDPINRKIKDASLLYDLLGKFADNPEALLKLLPFNELGEEGLLAKEALNQGRNEDAGRHLFKAVVSAIMDVGPTVILGKLAEAAGLNKLLKELQMSEFATLGNLSSIDRVRLTNKLPPNAKLFQGGDAIDQVFGRLETHQGVPRDVASDRLHSIKTREGLGGADNVVLDATGNVFHPVTGEHIGTLTVDP